MAVCGDVVIIVVLVLVVLLCALLPRLCSFAALPLLLPLDISPLSSPKLFNLGSRGAGPVLYQARWPLATLIMAREHTHTHTHVYMLLWAHAHTEPWHTHAPQVEKKSSTAKP